MRDFLSEKLKHIFKPLRNYVRQFDRLSFLAAIYSLSNHLEWNLPLPDDLKAANPYNKQEKIRLGFFQWELDTLAREAILHCPDRGGKNVSWAQMRKALNLLKQTENEAFSQDSYDVFAELTRIAHRQFHWQQSVSLSDITRYRRIYRKPGMDELMRAEFGLNSEEYFVAAFGLMATFLKHAALLPEFAASAEKSLGVPVVPLIDGMSSTVPQLKERSLSLQSLDIDWAYTFHPLRAHPLIRLDDGRTFCPLPGLFARRFTDGLYFDFATNPDNLSRHLGPAFQAYTGDVLNAANKGRFTVLGEERFGTAGKPKDSVDWIAEDVSAALFVECKVLRLSHVAKASLAPIDRELRKLARGVAQLYSTVADALDGKYPHWKPSSKPPYPLLVTLDNWNLFTHTTQGAVREMIEQELLRKGMDATLLDRHPYSVCSIRELESAIQVMHQTSINAVMSGLTTGEKAGHMFGPYLLNDFRDELAEVEPLFPDEPRELLPVSMS